MSGIRRAIVAELANKGLTGEKAMAYMNQAEMASENGRSLSRGADDSYLGKNAQKSTR